MDDGIEVGAQTASTEDEQREQLERTAVIEMERLLIERGPMEVETLCETFSAEFPDLLDGLLAGRPAEDAPNRLTGLLRQAEQFWRLADGRLAAVLHHLRRATFTHRLGAGELEREAIDLLPDLVALALPRHFTLGDGTEIRISGGGEDPRAALEGSLLGPDGWLADYAVGDVVAVRYDGERAELDRAVALDDSDAPSGAEAVVGALREAFDGLRGERAPEVHRLVVDTMGRHPAAFSAAVAPLSELLERAGIERREAWVGEATTAWQSPPEQARRRRLDELLTTGADDCCQRAARRALDAWHGWLNIANATGTDPVPSAAEAARAAEDIDHGPVAALLAEVATIGRPLLTVRRLGDWAAAVAAVSSSSTAGAEYLQALGADAVGDATAAEAHLEAGLQAEPGHPACLGFQAELAADRGDAQRSLGLAQQAGRPPGAQAMAELAPFLPSRQVGRNETCPCGSGRKFKVCCAREPKQRPLVERGRWLLSKASRHAVRTDPMAVQSLRQLFDMSGGAPGAGGGEAMALVGDLLLFANRGLARYLECRGALLPADELAAARSWLAQPMRLLQVLTTDGAGNLAAIDVRTDETLHIVDPAAGTSLAAGETVLTRALPAGEAHLRTSALVRIPPNGRDRALALLEDEVRPFQLLQLLIDLQVDALRG